MAVDAEYLFKQLLRDLRPLLKEHGFRASSQNFILQSPECWGIINFQKSRWSDPGEKTFYVNVAITAKRLLEFNEEPSEKAPVYYKCEWIGRIEQFCPPPKVSQWSIRDSESALSALAHLRVAFQNIIIPLIGSLMTERALLEDAQGYGLGGFPFIVLKAKSILFALNGDSDGVRNTIFELAKNTKPGFLGLQDHLNQMRKKFPELMRVL